jgi:hypothetical protein
VAEGTFSDIWHFPHDHSLTPITVRCSISTIHCKTLNNFSKVCYSPLVFADTHPRNFKLRQRREHGSTLARSGAPPIHLTQAISFQTLTHSFARRPTPIPFSFNHFRTLCTATEGVPSLHSDFAPFWCSLNPSESAPMGMSATVDSKPLAANSKSFRCNTYTKPGGGGRERRTMREPKRNLV